MDSPESNANGLRDLFKHIGRISDEVALHSFVYVLQAFHKLPANYSFTGLDTAPTRPYSHLLERDLLTLMRQGDVRDTGTTDSLVYTPKAELLTEGLTSELAKLRTEDICNLGRILFAAEVFRKPDKHTSTPAVAQLREKILHYLWMTPQQFEQHFAQLQQLEQIG